MNLSSVCWSASRLRYRCASLCVLLAISSAACSSVTPNSFAMLRIAFLIDLNASAFPVFLPGTHSFQIPSANSPNLLEDMGEAEEMERVEEGEEVEEEE